MCAFFLCDWLFVVKICVWVNRKGFNGLFLFLGDDFSRLLYALTDMLRAVIRDFTGIASSAAGIFCLSFLQINVTFSLYILFSFSIKTYFLAEGNLSRLLLVFSQTVRRSIQSAVNAAAELRVDRYFVARARFAREALKVEAQVEVTRLLDENLAESLFLGANARRVLWQTVHDVARYFMNNRMVPDCLEYMRQHIDDRVTELVDGAGAFKQLRESREYSRALELRIGDLEKNVKALAEVLAATRSTFDAHCKCHCSICRRGLGKLLFKKKKFCIGGFIQSFNVGFFSFLGFDGPSGGPGEGGSGLSA